jgi:hypothetical protein
MRVILQRMRIDDYEHMPIGTKVDGGEIAKCTQCGKPGLAEISGTSSSSPTTKLWVLMRRARLFSNGIGIFSLALLSD